MVAPCANGRRPARPNSCGPAPVGPNSVGPTLCWAACDAAAELIDGGTGLLAGGGGASRVSSVALLEAFADLCRCLRGTAPPAAMPAGGGLREYIARKRELAAPEYAAAKDLVFSRTPLRSWTLAKAGLIG